MRVVIIVLLLNIYALAQDINCCGCPNPIQWSRVNYFDSSVLDSLLYQSSYNSDFESTPVGWLGGTRENYNSFSGSWSYSINSNTNGSIAWVTLSDTFISQIAVPDTITLSANAVFYYSDSTQVLYLKMITTLDEVIVDSVLIGSWYYTYTPLTIKTYNKMIKSIAVGHRSRTGESGQLFIDDINLYWRKPMPCYEVRLPETYLTSVTAVTYNEEALSYSSGKRKLVTSNEWDYDLIERILYVNVGENPNTAILNISPALNDTLWYGYDGFDLSGVVYKKSTYRPTVIKYKESVLVYLSAYQNSPQQLYSGSWTWNNDTLYVRLPENPNANKIYACYTVAITARDSGLVSVTPKQVTYALNQPVIITATPNTNWSFVTWRGSHVSDQAVDTITVGGSQTIWARFRKTEQQYRVVISGDNSGGHETYMLNSFKKGYESWGGSWNNDNVIIVPSLQDGGMFKKADEYGAELVIRSYTDWYVNDSWAKIYYPTNYFAPTGANWITQLFNSDGVLPTTILTGVGTDSCVTAFDVELIGNDPVSDSSSNWLVLPNASMSPCSVTVSGTVDVVGVNSQFTSGLSSQHSFYYFAPGERIVVNGETRVVTEVIDNTHLTVNAPFNSSGTFSPAYQIQNLSSFSNPYIAGQMLYLADLLGTNIWTIRYLMRSLNTYAGKKGFGAINRDQIMNAYNVLMNYGSLDYYLGLENRESFEITNADTIPTGFAFTDITECDLSTEYTSNAALPTNADSATIYAWEANYRVKVSGGTWGNWLTDYGMWHNGDSVQVKNTSSSSYSTAVNTILTIGGVSDTFTITTKAPLYESVKFVSPWGGGDTLTYTELQSTNLVSGDTVLFLRGYTYNGPWTIDRDTCSGEWGRIYIGAYASGAKPELSMLTTLSKTWTKQNDSVYYTNVSPLYRCFRMWLNDTLYMPALEYPGKVVKHDATWKGLPATNEYYYSGIDRDQRFHLPYESTTLYIYALDDPNTFYNDKIKVPGYPEDSDGGANLYLDDACYVTFENLKLAYGFRTARINKANHLTMNNCDIYGHQWHGLIVPMNITAGNTDSIIISNCNFDYGLDFYKHPDSILAGWQPFHDDSGVEGVWLNSKGVTGGAIYNNGIAIWFSGVGWKIYNNTFKNYTLAALEPTNASQTCRNAEVYNNIFTNQSQSGRAINIYDAIGGNYFNLKFYKNKIDGMKINALQIFGDSCFFYYNLFTNSLETNPQVYNESGELWQQWYEVSTYFWNNTVVNTGKYGFEDWSATAQIYNNILINMGSHPSIDYIRNINYNSGTGLSVYNNTFYAQGKNSSSTLFYLGNNYNISNFEEYLSSGANNYLQTSAASYLTALIYDADFYFPKNGYTGQGDVYKTEFMRWKIGPNFFDLSNNRITNSDGTWVTTIQRGYLNEVK